MGVGDWDEDFGYDRFDPKHPDWADDAAYAADLQRKKEREEPVTTTGPGSEESDAPDAAGAR